MSTGKHVYAQNKIYVYFINYKTAFDMVKQEKLITFPQNIRLDEKVIIVDSSLYWEYSATICSEKMILFTRAMMFIACSIKKKKFL